MDGPLEEDATSCLSQHSSERQERPVVAPVARVLPLSATIFHSETNYSQSVKFTHFPHHQSSQLGSSQMNETAALHEKVLEA